MAEEQSLFIDIEVPPAFNDLDPPLLIDVSTPIDKVSQEALISKFKGLATGSICES